MERRMCTWTGLALVLSTVGGLNVNIPNKVYEYARGDNITLPCTFKPKAGANLDFMVISWLNELAVAGAKETQIISYYSNGVIDTKKAYEGRVSLDLDVAKGKADLKLSKITLDDNKFFKCRVQIPGDDEGQPAATTSLVVLVAPSTPVCKLEGKAQYGQDIKLTCLSAEGSPTPTYSWESRDVKNLPRAPAPRSTDKGGVLSLYNITKETSGYYICTARNKIRSASCNITLAVMPPSINLGSTAGIIGGIAALVGVGLLILIIYCCCCKKKKEKEHYAMGVRGEEYTDKEPTRNGESRRADGEEDARGYDDSSVRSPTERNDGYEEQSERNYENRSDYNDRRSDYNDRRSDYDDRRSDYNERRSDYDDRRSDYDDRRSDYDERRSDYSDRRDRYSDRNERYDDKRRYDDDDRYNDDRRYNDERRYDDRRDRRTDDDNRYDEPYDDRDRPPRVPANKPPRRDYDD